MVEVSIVCLIYKSKELAEALYESVLKYTPKLATGQAEFLFVANDPTEEVVEYLKLKSIPYYINTNSHLTEDELFQEGFGAPEYMRRVYQGYNFGVLRAKGQKVVLINSDNFFSEDWLENLLKYSDYKKVVCSTLVEPGQRNVGIFPFAIEKDFGRNLQDFKENKFQEFAQTISTTGFTSGGAYMPCLLYKDVAIMAGLYPEGNIAGKSFGEVSRFGDEYFYDRLKEFGIEHITAKDSIVYHLKEGEKSLSKADSKMYSAAENVPTKFNERLIVETADLMPYISPDIKHLQIIDQLSKKVSILILSPKSIAVVERNLRTIERFDFKNVEIILLSGDKNLTKVFSKRVKSVYAVTGKIDTALYEIFHKMYGEQLLVINEQCDYAVDLLDKIDDRNKIYYFGGIEKVGKLITDYMGNFIFPKSLLLRNIPTFLGFLVEKNILEVDFSNFDVVDVSAPKLVPVENYHEQTTRNVISKVKSKIKNDGIIGLASHVKRKVFSR